MYDKLLEAIEQEVAPNPYLVDRDALVNQVFLDVLDRPDLDITPETLKPIIAEAHNRLRQDQVFRKFGRSYKSLDKFPNLG